MKCLLLHGLASLRADILPLAKIIENHEIECFTPHLLGHRHTLPRDYEINYQNIELELDCYMKYLTQDFTEKILVVGQSFGAMLALFVAEKYPNSIKGVIVLSPSLILRNQFFDYGVSLLKIVPDFIVKSLPNIQKKWVSKKHSGSESHYSPNLLRLLSIFRTRISAKLHLLTMPIYILQSIDDYHLSPISALKIKELAKNSNVKVALRELGNNHQLAHIPKIESLMNEAINFISSK